MKSRLRERVRGVLASLLPTLKDPRIGFLTITDVELTRDGEHATVWYTVMPDSDEQRGRTAAGLASAAPLLRRELAAALSVRKVPSLDFRPDPAPEQGRRIEDLLRKVAAPAATERPDGGQAAPPVGWSSLGDARDREAAQAAEEPADDDAG